METTLIPTLAVRDAPAAIDFYARALGATELSRHVVDGTIVHAELAVDGARFAVKEADPTDPPTPALLTLQVPDADTLWDRVRAAGATVVFPLADHEYGYRQGRVADPYGHRWIVSQPL